MQIMNYIVYSDWYQHRNDYHPFEDQGYHNIYALDSNGDRILMNVYVKDPFRHQKYDAIRKLVGESRLIGNNGLASLKYQSKDGILYGDCELKIRRYLKADGRYVWYKYTFTFNDNSEIEGMVNVTMKDTDEKGRYITHKQVLYEKDRGISF
jgi:hypothetical protein